MPRSLTRDERHAGLDQPAGQQARLADGRPAVLVADRVGLVVDPEGRLGGARGQQRVGLLGELVAAGRQRRRRDVVGELVERLDHVAAAEQAVERDAVGRASGS